MTVLGERQDGQGSFRIERLLRTPGASFFVMKTIYKARHDKATRLSAGNAVEELCQADARDESGVQPRDWSLFK